MTLAQNDADFEVQDMLEHAELVAEHFDEKGHPEMTEQARSIMRGEHQSKLYG